MSLGPRTLTSQQMGHSMKYELGVNDSQTEVGATWGRGATLWSERLLLQKPKGSGDERVKEPVPGHPLFKTLVHFPTASHPASSPPSQRGRRPGAHGEPARPREDQCQPQSNASRFSDPEVRPWAAAPGRDPSRDLRPQHQHVLCWRSPRKHPCAWLLGCGWWAGPARHWDL